MKKVFLRFKPLLLLAVMWMLSPTLSAQTFTYTYSPNMGQYTNTGGSDTHTDIWIDNTNDSYDLNKTRTYDCGIIKATVLSHNISTEQITFRIAKQDGDCFQKGTSGKIYVYDVAAGSVSPVWYSISNTSTSYVNATFKLKNFNGLNIFRVFLLNTVNGHLNKFYGGEFRITGTGIGKPAVATGNALDITSSSATLSGSVNPNGATTSWHFAYGTTIAQLYDTSGGGSIQSTANRADVYSTITGLKPNTTYYYRIEASNSEGEAAGYIKNFTTEGSSNTAPTTPSDPLPAQSATGVPTSGTFSWATSDADGDNISYTLYLGKSSSAMSPYDMGSGTRCSYEDLDAGQKYYWRVDVSDGQTTVSGPTWNFTTASASSATDNEAISYLINKKVIDGPSVSDAHAEELLTRSQLAKIAFRGVHLIFSRQMPSTVVSDYFPTVYEDLSTASSTNAYYYQAARALLYLDYGDGITPFDRNRLNFSPDDNISRLHTLKVMMETFNIKPDRNASSNPFPTDDDVISLIRNNPQKAGYILKAAQLGIITTSNAKFRPHDNCSRGEAFIMLARIMKAVEAYKIADPNPQEQDYYEPLNTTLKTLSLGAGLSMGNFDHYSKVGFSINGVMPLVFAHNYNSYNTTLPGVFYGEKSVEGKEETYQPLGSGWSHSYHSFVALVDDRAVVHWGGGRFDVYRSNGKQFVPESMDVYDEMTITSDEVRVKTTNQMEYRFSNQGGTGAAVVYLSAIVDRNGNMLTFNYANGQRGTKQLKNVSDGQRRLTFDYLSGINLLSAVTDPMGRTVRFGYDYDATAGEYLLTSYTDANGQTTRYEYDDTKRHLLTRIQLPKGNYIENQYDLNSRLTKTEAGQNGTPTTRTSVAVATDYRNGSVSTRSSVNVERGGQTTTTEYVFNGNNAVTSMKSNEGREMTAAYTNSSHPQLPTSVRTNDTHISNIAYDARGNMTSITQRATDGSGSITQRMTYNTMNDLTQMVDGNGNITTFDYDDKGNLIKVNSPEGTATQIEVDSRGLPQSLINPMGIRTEYRYDTHGNQVRTAIPAIDLQTRAEYDLASRIVRSYDGKNRITEYDYDDNDLLVNHVTPMNSQTSYNYDQNDNLIAVVNANDETTEMTYDFATDWLTSMSFGGYTRHYDYNKDGTLRTLTKPDGTQLSYRYDGLGRMLSDGVNSYTYNTEHRLASVAADGNTMTFDYDGYGRVSKVSWNGKGNGSIAYAYDANGNLVKMTYPSGKQVSYAYDGLNRLTKVTDWNNKTTTYSYRKDSKMSRIDYPNGMTTVYDYDSGGRLTSMNTTLKNGTTVASYSYTLDKAGNIIAQQAVEPISQRAGTVADVEYRYDEANRITQAGDIQFEFDANGNTIRRGNDAYTWDRLDRLVAADGKSLEYDPLGNLRAWGDVQYVVDPQGMGNVLSDTKTGGQYVYGNGLLSQVMNNGTTYYCVADMRGSIVAMVDGNGNITHKYQYDEFGNITQSEEQNFNPFRYVGKYGVIYHTDHRYYMRARHYDPTIGRFLSEDPIWNTNLYPYTDNNPIMGIDPKGEAGIETMGIGYEIYQGAKTATSVGTKYGLSAGQKAFIAKEAAKDAASADALLGGSSGAWSTSSSSVATSSAAIKSSTAGMSAGAYVGAAGCTVGIGVLTVVLVQDASKAVKNANKSESYTDFISRQNENGGWLYKGSQKVGNGIAWALDNTLGRILK